MITNYNFRLNSIKNLSINNISKFINLEKPIVYKHQSYINISSLRKVKRLRTENYGTLILPKIVMELTSPFVNSIYGNTEIIYSPTDPMDYFFQKHYEKVDLPKLKFVGNFFLTNCTNLEIVKFENLKKTGECFLMNSSSVVYIDLPKIEFFGISSLAHCSVINLDLPNLKKVEGGFLSHSKKIKKIDLPNLIEAGNYFMDSTNVVSVTLKKLVKVGKSFLLDTKFLEKLEIPNIDDYEKDF